LSALAYIAFARRSPALWPLWPDDRALLEWLKHFKKPPRKTFVVHGEQETAQGFGELIHEQLGWTVEVPAAGATAEW